MFAVSQIPWSIKCVSSAEEALRQICQGGIDVVVTDLKMPGTDGMMLLTQLRNDLKTENIPVVLLTGKGNVPSIQTPNESWVKSVLFPP